MSLLIASSVTTRGDGARGERARILAQAVGGRVVTDPRADLPPSPAGVWRVTLRGWQEGLATPGVTHVAVLQDDCRFPVSLRRWMRDAVASRPEDVLTFYAGQRREVREAAQAGEAWVRLDRFLGGLAMCMPVDIVRDFLTWERHSEYDAEPGGIGNDVRTRDYCQARGLGLWASVPSLVDHDVGLRSTMARGQSSRTAAVPWDALPNFNPAAEYWTCSAALTAT